MCCHFIFNPKKITTINVFLYLYICEVEDTYMALNAIFDNWTSINEKFPRVQMK
jgi:hypothetical protein